MSLSWDWDDGDSEELAALRDLVRRFIDKEIAPHHARWEREGQVSRELWRKAGELGVELREWELAVSAHEHAWWQI